MLTHEADHTRQPAGKEMDLCFSQVKTEVHSSKLHFHTHGAFHPRSLLQPRGDSASSRAPLCTLGPRWREEGSTHWVPGPSSPPKRDPESQQQGGPAGSLTSLQQCKGKERRREGKKGTNVIVPFPIGGSFCPESHPSIPSTIHPCLGNGTGVGGGSCLYPSVSMNY